MGKNVKQILRKLDSHASLFYDGNDKLKSTEGNEPIRKKQKTSARMKKKLRKLRKSTQEKVTEVPEQSTSTDELKRTKKEKFLDDMEINLTKYHPIATENQQVNALVKLNAKSTYSINDKVVVFCDLAKKNPKISNIDKVEEPVIKRETNIFDMKKARHEVLRYGISGFDKKNKEEANMALAIKLGAKPPKKTYKNYKILMQEKKSLKETEKEELNSTIKPSLTRMSGNKKNKPRDKNKVAGFDSQIGRYKNGMQIVSKRDIQNVTRSSKKGGKISAIKGI